MMVVVVWIIPLNTAFVKDAVRWMIIIVLVKTRALLWLYTLSAVDRLGDQTGRANTSGDACSTTCCLSYRFTRAPCRAWVVT